MTDTNTADEIDPDRPCPHDEFQVVAEVHKIVHPTTQEMQGVLVDVRGWCARCDEALVWRPSAMGPRAPQLSPDGKLIRVPGRVDDQAADAVRLWVPGGPS